MNKVGLVKMGTWKFLPNSLRKLSVIGQIGLTVGVLAVGSVLRASATDALLGTALGVYLWLSLGEIIRKSYFL